MPPPAAVAALGVALPSLSPAVHTLDNGLTVIIERHARTDEVALYVKYRVGARDELPREKGLAHLFEHLMFERSAHVPQDGFDTLLTAAGGWNNAYTSHDETVYHMVVPSGALDLALFLESDRMGFLDAGLDAANLDNQRGVVLQERATGFDQPYGKVWDLLQMTVATGEHPSRISPIGTVADVEAFDLPLVRAFWERHCTPQNAVLVIVGNVDPDATLARVTHWFSDVPARAAPAPRPGLPAGWTFEPMNVVLEDNVDDRRVLIAWPTVPATHPDAPALEILSDILSNGRGTRIDDRLYYDANLATETGAWQEGGELDGAFIVLAASPRTPLPRLVKALDRELARVVDQGVSAAEVERAARGRIFGLLDATETVDARAETLLACHDAHGTPDCLAAEVDAYRAVTADDVRRVARTWLDPRRRSTLSVVPRGDAGALPGATPLELP